MADNPWQPPEPVFFLLAPIVDLIARIVARIHVRGVQRIPRRGPALIVANHVSHLDPLVLFSLLHRRGRRSRFIAVSGLWDVPLVGWLLRKGRMIAVHRGAGAQPMVEAACRALRHDQTVVVYPEGTIVGPGVARRGRPGAGLLAIATDAPVIPVAMQGVDAWNGRIPRLRHDVNVWVGDPVDLSAWDGRQDREAGIEASGHLLDCIRALLPAGAEDPSTREGPA